MHTWKNKPSGYRDFSTAKCGFGGQNIPRVMKMASYIDPKLRDRFESLSIDLKNAILEKNVSICSLQDLIRCLESIVGEK